MAITVVGCGGITHQGTLLFCASSSSFPSKKAASFTPQKLSSISTLYSTRRDIRVSKCFSQRRRNLNGLEVEIEVGSLEKLEDFLVVSFYKFMFVKDPQSEVSKHLSFLQGRDIHGRIYMNEQGINAQYSGPKTDALAYAEWVKDDQRFSDILVQTSPALNGHAFPRLKVRYKPSLVQAADTDPLAGIDKKNTDILMYCTGGIRCDVYSTILRQSGFQNLYTLSGGVSHYLKSEGSARWIGNLFVFDSRLSLPPLIYKPGGTAEERSEMVCASEKRHEVGYQNGTFARCYICNSRLTEFRHRNCANLDCNRLILSCTSCVQELRGCCCLDCTNSPRLRPVLPGNQRYQKWHLYRDGVFQ